MRSMKTKMSSFLQYLDYADVNWTIILTEYMRNKHMLLRLNTLQIAITMLCNCVVISISTTDWQQLLTECVRNKWMKLFPNLPFNQNNTSGHLYLCISKLTSLRRTRTIQYTLCVNLNYTAILTIVNILKVWIIVFLINKRYIDFWENIDWN